VLNSLGARSLGRSTVSGEATEWLPDTIIWYEKMHLLVGYVGLLAACEQKTTTVNPLAEKKESNTTIVNPPSEKKETNTTVVNPPGANSTTTKEEKTEVNVNTSPNP
jgi:hypothetical protein